MENKGFILVKNTHTGGKKWSENSELKISYYVGKDETGDVDVYSKDIRKAIVFRSNRERVNMRAPNPFKRSDVTKKYVSDEFNIREKKEVVESKNEGTFSKMLDKLKELI